MVVSRPTGKRLLTDGVRHCVDDICVPVKLYYGHVLDLKDRVDHLLVQRVISVEDGESDTFTCPKMMGLPDMIKSSLTDIPPIVEFRMDMRNRSLMYTARRLAEPFATGSSQVRKGLSKALDVQGRYESALRQGVTPDDAIEELLSNGGNGNTAVKERGLKKAKSGDVNIALVGHEYLIHDPYISHDISGKLERCGANVTYMSQVPENTIRAELVKYPEISWSYEKELLGAASYFLNRKDMHGVMMVIGFACGPDSIISEIITREVRRESSPPIFTLVLDEHTGEAGVATRIEAFVDLVRRSQKR